MICKTSCTHFHDQMLIVWNCPTFVNKFQQKLMSARVDNLEIAFQKLVFSTHETRHIISFQDAYAIPRRKPKE